MGADTDGFQCAVCDWSISTDTSVAEASDQAIEHHLQTGHLPIERIESAEENDHAVAISPV